MFLRGLLILAFFVGSLRAAPIDLERAMILVPPSGGTPEDAAIVRGQERVGAAHATLPDYERLGWAFVAKARRTLDPGWYKLAEATTQVMDARFGPTPEAALLRGHVDHNLHRFHDAELIARRLVAERGLPEDWALLSDALMEQGKLAESVDALQRMDNLKPSAEADTRIAQLRWLKGDSRGAIAAMANALRETSVADPTDAAWMLSRLSWFLLEEGDADRAEKLADAARQRVADYAPALLAAGRARLAKGDSPGAVPLLREAARLNPLPEYEWWLAEAQRTAGDSSGAAATEQFLKSRGETDDPRTLALFLATRREDLPAAVRLARSELGTRCDVLTHDALAWALYAAGDVDGASAEMHAALAEGTKDGRVFLHAALIAQARHDAAAARGWADECRHAATALMPSERRMLDQVSLALATTPAKAALTATARAR